MNDESGALSLFQAFTTMLDSMAKLFEMRADKAATTSDPKIELQYWRGMEAAYDAAARECRAAATRLREP